MQLLTAEEQVRGSQGDAFQEQGFNCSNNEAPLRAGLVFFGWGTCSYSPEQGWLQSPVFLVPRDVLWVVFRSFWLGPAQLCDHRAKGTFILGML